MGGHYLGHFKPLKQLDEFPFGPGVKVRCRLIDHQDLRAHGEDGGDGDALLLPHAEMVGRTTIIALHSHPLKSLTYPPSHLVLGIPHTDGTEGHIIENGGGKELVFRLLEHQPHLAPHPFKALILQGHTQNPYRAIAPEDAVEVKEQG